VVGHIFAIFVQLYFWLRHTKVKIPAPYVGGSLQCLILSENELFGGSLEIFIVEKMGRKKIAITKIVDDRNRQVP
jgi:hypothetical protein